MNDPIDPNAQQGGQNNHHDSNAQTGQSQGQSSAHPTPQAQPPTSAPMPPQQAAPVGQGQGVQPTGVTPPPQGNNLSGIMDQDVDVSNLVANASQNKQESEVLKQMPIPPHPNTTFDEARFVDLLTGSISLTFNEKKKIIEAISQLSQFQVDELIKIFDEEKGKFAELEKKHADEIAELERQHAAGSVESLQAQQEEMALKNQEEDEAERIKRELGLGSPASASRFDLAIHVNGQMVASVSVAGDVSEADAIYLAKSQPQVLAMIEGYQLVSELYVPGERVELIVESVA